VPVKRTRLAARRKVVGFSQEGLAECLKVDRTTVVRWERGETVPQPWKRAEFASALQVSVEELDELLAEEEPEPDNADQVPAPAIVGARLKSGRKERGWTARKLAEKLRAAAEDPREIPYADTLVGMVWRWEKGMIKPSETYRLLYCKLFGMSEEELFFSPDSARLPLAEGTAVIVSGGPLITPEVDELTARQSERNEGVTGPEFPPDIIEAVKRREFLAELAASTGLGAIGLPLEAARHGLNRSVAEERSAADADEWNQIVLEHGESYLTTAPSDLIKPLMVDIIGLQNALQRNSAARSNRDLMSVAALLSVFTAQTLMNIGQVQEARRWWRTAKICADRSGNPYSVLWVRAREINRAPEFRPAAAVLLLVDEAEGYVDHAPIDAVLEFLSAKALTLARVGRPNDAEGVLGQIRKRSSQLPGETKSLLVWDRAGRLHGIESFVYSRLGQLEKTRSANAAALELQDSGNVLWLADDEMKLAFCLVRKGDVAEGLRHAQTVLALLPKQYRSQYLVSDAHELVRSIPASGRQLNAAHEYGEWLSSL
jgi:transcriptional regulator with XRE-family HTH domain